jgi:hypothetical protein
MNRGAADMTGRWLRPKHYSSATLFLMAGIAAVFFAWNSFNLIHQAMENIRFLGSFGGMAVMDGGLLQLAEIIVRSMVSLAAYLLYKVCETELVSRWRS